MRSFYLQTRGRDWRRPTESQRGDDAGDPGGSRNGPEGVIWPEVSIWEQDQSPGERTCTLKAHEQNKLLDCILFFPANNEGLLNFQEEENERKRVQELEKQKVASKMEELETAKSLLENEMSMHKKRLQMEAQAARQVQAGCDCIPP